MGCRVGVASLGGGDGSIVICPGTFSTGSLFLFPTETVSVVVGAVCMGSVGISIVLCRVGKGPVAVVLSLVSVSLGSGSIEVSVWSEGFFVELRRWSPLVGL